MISWILTKPPVSQIPAEQKFDSKLLSLNGKSGLKLAPLLKRGKKSATRRRGKAKGGRSGAPGLPPELNTVMKVHQVLRFRANAATNNQPITAQMLAGACGGMCTLLNTQLSMWASSAKIHSIKIWPGLSSTDSNPEVLWLSPVAAVEKDDVKVRSVPGGVTVDKCVVARPPRGTLAVDWMNLTSLNTTQLLFLTGITADSIIDLSVTFTLSNDILGNTLGIVTGTVGVVYYLALDGPGGNKLRPIGVPTTA